MTDYPSQKMVLWLGVTVYLLGAVMSFDLCSDPNCICREGSLICNCHEKSDLNILKIENSSIESVEITNCGRVNLWFNCFDRMDFKSVILKNLKTLVLDSLAFLDISSIHFLLIENIESFMPKKFGMTVFKNAGRVIIQNVTAEILPTDLMTSRDMKDLHILNSNFKVIESSAFHFRQIEKFEFSGNRVGFMKTFAFKSDDPMDKVILLDNEIDYIESNSFVFPNVSTLSIANCTFNELHSKFLRSTAESFIFQDNTIQVCESNAFSYLNVTKTTVFQDNHIVSTEPNCLPDFTESNIVASVGQNTFPCDCHLSWIWKPNFNAFLKSSACSGTPGVPLTDLVPSLNEVGLCIQLINKTASSYYAGAQSSENEPSSTSEPFPYFWVGFIVVVCCLLAIPAVILVRKYKCQVACRKTQSMPF